MVHLIFKKRLIFITTNCADKTESLYKKYKQGIGLYR